MVFRFHSPWRTCLSSKIRIPTAVSVVTYEDRELMPLYVSPHRHRKHTIHLLLTKRHTITLSLKTSPDSWPEGPNITDKHIYVLIVSTASVINKFSTNTFPTAQHTPQTVTYPISITEMISTPFHCISICIHHHEWTQLCSVSQVHCWIFSRRR